MTAIQTNSIVRLPLSDKQSDHQDFFGSPWLNEQASKVKIGLNSFWNNAIENNLTQYKEFSTFEAQCLAELGEKKGKKLFREWQNSLGSVASYLARGIMKFGRWFNILKHGEQDIVRQNTQDWNLAWLKKLTKFPMEDVLDMALEGNLKAVVVGGMKEKKRELRVDGYAKVVYDPHDLNLSGKVGRLAHYCEEKEEWLCELPHSELTDSELPESGLATSNWFTAEQLEVANKPRDTSTQLGKNSQKIEGKRVKVSETTSQENEHATNPKNVDARPTPNIAPTSTQAAGKDETKISSFVQITPDSPSSNVDVHANREKNGNPLNEESHELDKEDRLESGQISFAQFQAALAEIQRLRHQIKYKDISREYEMEAELEQKIAQIRIDIESAALATAESRFSQKLQEKDAELAKLRSAQSSLDGKLILSPQELDDERRIAVAAEQQKTALAFQENQELKQQLIIQKDSEQTALAKASNYFNQQLQEKDQELAKLKALQLSLEGKLIFTPQELDERLRELLAAEREESAESAQANQEHHNQAEGNPQVLQQQPSELQPALYQARSDCKSDPNADKNNSLLDKEPDKEYYNLREEVEQYKAVVYSFVKASVESSEAITPQIAQDSLAEIIAGFDQPKTEVNAIPSSTNIEEKVALLETQLKEALQNNRNSVGMVKALQITIELKDKLHKAEMESKDYNKIGYSSTKPRTLLPFERRSNSKKRK